MYNWCRDGMPVMRSLYTFIQDCYFVPTQLWASARYEAWIMSCLVPLLFSDLIEIVVVSLDIRLDPEKGDLRRMDLVNFWFAQVFSGRAKQGAAGPPCT